MKKIYRIVMLTLLLSLCSAGSAAAKYKEISYEGEKVGAYSMWLDNRRLYMEKSGSSKVTFIKNVDAAISDGKTVYISRIQGNANRKTQLIKYAIAKKKISRLAVLMDEHEVFDMKHQRLIMRSSLRGYAFPEMMAYSLKTKKLTSITEFRNYHGNYKQYYFFDSYNKSGASSVLYIYNAKTNKTKRALSGVWKYMRSGNQIYYVRDLNGGRPYSAAKKPKIAVYRYSLKTGKQKALTKKVYMQWIEEFTKNKLVYLGWDNQSHTIWY